MKELEKKIKKIEKKIKYGDVLEFLYDGELVGSYTFVEWTIDSKTPLQWFRGCMCFEVALRGRTEDKVSVKFNGKVI